MAEEMVTVQLTAAQAQALEKMLEAAGTDEAPEHPSGETVSVVNESLGMNPHNGEKIQWRPGNGKSLSPAPKGFERWQRREQRRLEALAAAKGRSEKNKKSLVIQVEDMKDRIKGRNATDTIKLVELLNPHDREVAALAEEALDNRKTVLQHPGMKVSRKVRDQYDKEVAIMEDAALA